MKTTALLSAICILSAAAHAQRCDTIYYNGNILTGVGLHVIDDH